MKKELFLSLAKYLELYGVLLLASVGIGYLIQHLPFIIQFDNYFYVHINSLPHTPLLQQIVYPLDLWFFAMPIRILLFMPIFFYFIWALFYIPLFICKRKEFFVAVLALVIGLILAGFLLSFDWMFIFRQRPFLLLPNHVDETTKHVLAHWTSYPSGHTRDTAVTSTIIAKFFPRFAWLAFLFVALVGFTRVYTGEHYPTDVITGAVYGYIIGLLSIQVALIIMKKKLKKDTYEKN